MRGLAKASDYANRATEALLVPLVAFLAVLLILAVFSRYVLHLPIITSVEMTRIAFVWGCFLGAAVGLKRGVHVRMTFLTAKLPHQVRSLGGITANLGFLVLAAMMVWYGTALTRSMSVTYFPTLEISQSWLYLALPVSGALMLLHAASALSEIVVGAARQASSAKGEP